MTEVQSVTLKCRRCGKTRRVPPESLRGTLRPDERVRDSNLTELAKKRWAASNGWTNGHMIICPECQSE